MPTFNCNCNNPQNKKEASPDHDATNSYISPALSCQEIARSKPHQLPSYQWIKNSTFHPVMVYCTAATQCCSQGDVGWMRVANFDMSDPNQDCPQGFKQFSTPTRSCGRTLSTGGCQSMHFKSHGVQYSKVCGRVIGYQVGSTSGFYTPRQSSVIDNAYIEGVSITHGSSPARKHIWSFATALQSVPQGPHGPIHVCPCAISNSQMGQYIPSFVGNDYFCDTGNHVASTSTTAVYKNDPLWNGHGCSGPDTCCTFNNPPWFCKELPQSTMDDIEVRVCADEAANNEDSPIRLVELYVK